MSAETQRFFENEVSRHSRLNNAVCGTLTEIAASEARKIFHHGAFWEPSKLENHPSRLNAAPPGSGTISSDSKKQEPISETDPKASAPSAAELLERATETRK